MNNLIQTGGDDSICINDAPLSDNEIKKLYYHYRASFLMAKEFPEHETPRTISMKERAYEMATYFMIQRGFRT